MKAKIIVYLIWTGLLLLWGIFYSWEFVYADDCTSCRNQCKDEDDPIGCNKNCDNNECKKSVCLTKCVQWSKNPKDFCECKCNGGIVLNTDIPFVGRCILKDGTASGWWTAISGISRALTSIFMTLILTWGFAMIIWWWVQISMGDIKGGRSKIFNVIVVLWSLGILLRLINPNFFK